MREAPETHKILIAEDDAAIRDVLAEACEGLATTVLVSEGEAVGQAMAAESFDLLLLDWNLGSRSGVELLELAARLQPQAWRIILFTIPTIDALVKAMRAGAHDAWWVARGMELREHLLEEWLEKSSVSKGFPPLYLSSITESLSEKAATREVPFFEARREFSKIFIREIARRHSLSRNDLARWMGVSVRTLQRVLSADEKTREEESK